MSIDNYSAVLWGQVQVLDILTTFWVWIDPQVKHMQLCYKTQDFPARNAAVRASIALRRFERAVPASWRWSPPASCTCTCSAAVDAILHSFKNAQVVIIGSAEALPILCVRCARWERERERDTERERERKRERERERERERRTWRHHCRAKIGDEFTLSFDKIRTIGDKFTLSLAMPKIHTFRFSPHTSRLSLL